MNEELYDVIRDKAEYLYSRNPNYWGQKAGFVEGAEWLASNLPSIREISDALYETWKNDYMIAEVEYMTPIARNMLAESVLTLIQNKLGTLEGEQ